MPRLNPSANTKLRRHKSSERIRDEFPIVRTVQRRNGVVAYRVDCRSKGWIGQAIYEYPTRKQALEQARKIAEAVKARGVDTTSSAIVFQDTGELSEWNTQLATHGKTLKDAVQFYLNHLDTEAKRSQSLRMPDLLEQWNQFKQDPSQQLRPRSQQSIQWWSERFAKEFRKLRVTDVSYERLRKHYDTLKDTRARPASPRYRKQFLGYLGQFFNWCIQNGHTNANPTVRFKVRSSVPDAEFLNLKQCRRLVEVLNLPEFKMVRSSVVIGLFAGIRQAELDRMTWTDVNTDQNSIAVTRNNSKIRRGRSVPIEPVLKAWLGLCDTSSESLGKPPRRLMERFRKQVGFKLPQNVLRHTYATYWQSLHKNYATLADNLGNTEVVASRHYVRMVSQKDATEFWSLYPHSETLGQFFEVNPPV